MRTSEATTPNRILAAALFALHVAAWIVIPLWPSTTGGVLLAIAALSSNTLWSLLHEGIHGRLLPSKRANRLMSRVLSMCLGTPFAVVQASHLVHHAINRTPLERPDVLLPGSKASGRVAFYYMILGGLYIGELFMSLMFLMPPVVARRIAERSKDGARMVPTKLSMKETFDELRIDGFIITCVVGFAVWRAPLEMALFLATRAFLISFLDYVYHYRTRLDDVIHARNLDAGPLRVCLLGFNLHGVHHARPDLSWTELHPHFNHTGGRYDGSLPGAALSQLRGPFGLTEDGRVPA